MSLSRQICLKAFYESGCSRMNDCRGCKYENSKDIEIHLEFCTNCKRAYSNEEDMEFHEDRYETVD